MRRFHRARPLRLVLMLLSASGIAVSTLTLVGTAPASADAGGIAQHLGIPAYIDPTASPAAWTALSSLPQKGNIVVANVLNGPGSAPDPAWAAAIAAAHAAGDKVLGYVDTGYLASPVTGFPNGPLTRSGQSGLNAWLPQIDQDINAWYSYYGSNIDGIFFDDGTNTCGPAPWSNLYASTYAGLTSYVKNNHLGATTVLNPGTAVPQCYEDSADVLLTFEGSYGDYTGTPASPTEAYIPLNWDPVDPNKILHVIYGVPDVASLTSVVALSKSRGAGYIDVTNDVPANPYDTLPPADYFADEQADAAATGIASPSAPSAPQNLNADNSASTKVDLDWSESTGTSAPVVAYDVFENGVQIYSEPASETSFTVSGLLPATSYTFTVAARDAAGDESDPSAPVVTTTATPDPILPTAPGNLAVTSVGFSSVALDWSPSSGDAGIANYEVFEGTTEVAFLPRSMTNATVGVAEPGLGTFTFSVRAVDSSGNVSPPSAYVAATTEPIPGNQPVANPSVVTNADGSITYSADFPLPFAFRRAFIATDDTSLSCWEVSSPQPICASYLIENGQFLRYAGTGTDFTWTPVAQISPVLSGVDTYSWTIPAADLGSPGGQTVVFNGEGYTPIAWSGLIEIGNAPAPALPFTTAEAPALEQAVLTALGSAAAPLPQTPPVPVASAAECPATPDGQWHVTREEGCLVGNLTFNNSLLDGLLVGGFTVGVTDVVTLSPATRAWTETVTLNMSSTTGNVPPYSVAITPTCTDACTEDPAVTLSLVPNEPVTATFNGSDLGSSDTKTFNISWAGQLTPQIPAVTLPFTPSDSPSTFQWSTPDLRCDSAWASGTPGCVFPEFIPTFNSLSLHNSNASDVAENIADAQRSLDTPWGVAPSGVPLAFTSNAQLVAANVEAANQSCNSFGHNSGNSRCDTYPFASTYQGASQNGDVSTTAVSRSDEIVAKRLLTSWYAAEHLIDGDQFWVRVHH